jgi:hypothetical protein
MVVLLQSSGERAVAAMRDLTAQGLADRTRVGVMSVGCHPLRGVINDSDGLRRSKRLAASMSRFSALHRVNQVAFSIDGSIQVAPCPFDVDVGFIHLPRPRLFAHVAWTRN